LSTKPAMGSPLDRSCGGGAYATADGAPAGGSGGGADGIDGGMDGSPWLMVGPRGARPGAAAPPGRRAADLAVTSLRHASPAHRPLAPVRNRGWTRARHARFGPKTPTAWPSVRDATPS